jgi:putative membrane fusion protein
VFEDAAASVTQEGLEALKQELEVLENSSTADTVSLTSEVSGLFSTVLDGYESLGPDDLQGLSPDGLRALMGEQKEVAAGAYGKLITAYNWYFAAIMNVSDAQNFSDGGSASLEFGRYYSAALTAEVLSVGEPDEDGKCVVVFSLDRAMADTLAMRLVSAEVVFQELQGIRVPYEAVHTEEGQAFVYTVTGLVCERKDIEIVCDTGEYYLAQTGGELRIGNDIILGGRDLYDGKILD